MNFDWTKEKVTFEEAKDDIPKYEDNDVVPEFETGNEESFEESPTDNINSLESILLDDFKKYLYLHRAAWLLLQNMKSKEAELKEADEK